MPETIKSAPLPPERQFPQESTRIRRAAAE
jgi:hypothetical protein